MVSIPDEAGEEAYHSSKVAAYGLCVGSVLHVPHSRQADVMPAMNESEFPHAAP
jgi:hypothetical protein